LSTVLFPAWDVIVVDLQGQAVLGVGARITESRSTFNSSRQYMKLKNKR